MASARPDVKTTFDNALEPAAPATRRWGPGLRLVLLCALLAALASHVSLFYISRHPEPRRLFGDEVTYLDAAREIASGAGWTPHPFWPPLYPWFLAAVLGRDGGIGRVYLAQEVMLLLGAALFGDLARRLSGSREAGTVTGWLVLVYPPLVAYAGYLWPEVLHLLLFSGALWILVARSDRPLWLPPAGLLLGLATATKYLLLPFLPVLLLPLVLSGSWRARATRVTLVALGFGAVTLALPSPRQDDSPAGLRLPSSSLFNLWVGLNDRSRRSFVDPVVGPEYTRYNESAATLRERDAILVDKILERVRSRGARGVIAGQLSRQYFRLLDKDSYLTDFLPGGALAAAGAGYVDPPRLLAVGLKWTSYAMYSCILVGALVGMRVCGSRPWLRVGVAFLAYNLAIFFVLHVKSRYRVPILPFLFLYAGCAVAWGGEKLRLVRTRPGLWMRGTGIGGWLLTFLAAGLLLFFAWGGPLLE